MATPVVLDHLAKVLARTFAGHKEAALERVTAERLVRSPMLVVDTHMWDATAKGARCRHNRRFRTDGATMHCHGPIPSTDRMAEGTAGVWA